MGDYKMIALMIVGKMDEEVERVKLATPSSEETPVT